MKKNIKYIAIGLALGSIGISSATIVWPAAPSGEPTGGLFMTYIQKMLVDSNISTTDGKVKKALDANTLGSGTVTVSGTYVGIGNSNPNSKLDVNGKITANALQITNGYQSGYILTSDRSGNGIWQANNYRLKVNGLFQNFSGARHTCVLMDDGTVKCWGLNDNCQLGAGSNTTNRSLPVTVAGLTGVSKIYTVGRSTYALINDGTIYSWGYNGYGQLGFGNTSNYCVATKIPGISNVTEMYPGHGNSADRPSICAKIGTGSTSTAKCWGYNGYGQLGDGTTVQKNVPTDVVGLSNIKYIKITGFGSGGHACALLNDGTVKCWGYNRYGQLGLGNTTSYSVPTSVPGISNVRDLYIADGRTCVVLNDNTTLKCWGYNRYGQIGDGTTVQKNSPVAITTGGGNISSVVMNDYDYQSSYIVFTDGTVKSAGYNGAGQLGLGDLTNRSAYTSISGLTGVKKIVYASVNGYQYACALINDGTIKCWGHNSNGWLGVGDTTSRNSPTQVLGINNAVDIMAQGGVNTSGNEGKTCALLNDGSLKCWGYNGYGQLGTGDTISYYIPVTVKNLNTD